MGIGWGSDQSFIAHFVQFDSQEDDMGFQCHQHRREFLFLSGISQHLIEYFPILWLHQGRWAVLQCWLSCTHGNRDLLGFFRTILKHMISLCSSWKYQKPIFQKLISKEFNRLLPLSQQYFIFKNFYLFIFGERGRQGGREGEKHQWVVASHAPPIGDRACKPGMCPDWESNQKPLASQAGTTPARMGSLEFNSHD